MPPCLKFCPRHVSGVVLVTLSALLHGTPTWAGDVWIVTDTHHPVIASPGIPVTELDAPARLETLLSSRLPSDPAQAATIVRQRLQAGGINLQQRFKRAYQGVTDAWHLGIIKLPAVVVDQHYVVYGNPNVAQAVAQIERYRGQHP